jgi:hypothetical protein
VASFLRSIGRRRQRPEAPELATCGDRRAEPGPAADGVPRGFAEPIAVVDLEALPPERLEDGRFRVTFWANVRDARGDRCPDVAIDARIEGPERSGEGMAWTDDYGQVRIRTTGPPGAYRCVITGAGAGAVEVRRGADGVIAARTTTVEDATREAPPGR